MATPWEKTQPPEAVALSLMAIILTGPDHVMFTFLCFELLLLTFVLYGCYGGGCGFSIFIGCCFLLFFHADENDVAVAADDDGQDEQCRHSSISQNTSEHLITISE